MIPTSAVTSPLHRRVMKTTPRRGGKYLSLLLIEIWLRHAKGLSRLHLMLIIRAPFNPIANILHIPARVPHSCSLLPSSGCPVTREHSYLNPMLRPCKESDGEGKWIWRGVILKATASMSNNIILSPARHKLRLKVGPLKLVPGFFTFIGLNFVQHRFLLSI